MALLVLAAILLVLVSVPIVRGILNPVVNVVDDLRTARPYAEVDADIARLLGDTRGYELQMLLPGTYTLSYRRTPGWALVLGLVTFPLGILVIFLARETYTLTFAVTAFESGSRVTVVGRAHQNVATGVGAAVERRLRARPAADDRLDGQPRG